MNRRFTLTKKDFILLIILGITILLVDYSFRWYQVYKEHNLNTSMISKYVVEITLEDFPNYIAENSDAIVYMGIPEDVKCRSFERKLKKIVSKYNLRDEIVYLNVKNTDINAVTNQYSSDELRSSTDLIIDVPTIAFYNNSKIIEYIDYNNSDMKDDTIIGLFIKYGIMNYND